MAEATPATEQQYRIDVGDFIFFVIGCRVIETSYNTSSCRHLCGKARAVREGKEIGIGVIEKTKNISF